MNIGDENMKRSVMLLCDYRAPYKGNFVSSLLNLEKRLVEKDIDVVFVFATGAEKNNWFWELRNSGKTLEIIDFRKKKYQLLKDMQRLISKYEICILHSHFVSILVMEAFAALVPDVKVLIHVHSDFTGGKYNWKNKLRDFLTYRVFAQNVRILSVSIDAAKKNPKRVKYIPNALADERIPSVHIDGKMIRESLNVCNQEILIECFGWSPWIKGLDVAVETVKRLRDKNKRQVKLAIVCGQEMASDKIRKWIDDHTSCTGNEEYICYLEPTEDVFSYHEAADILLSASRSEGFSYAILEMLGIGKRCVVSDILGVSWTKEFPSVRWFESGNTEACVASLISAIDLLPNYNPTTAEMVKQNYSIHRWTDGILQEYGI